MKPLTKTVVSKSGGIAARFLKGGDAPALRPKHTHDKPPVVSTEPAAGVKSVANTVANPVANVANKPRYERWREANPELYKARQADYMRKKRAADKAEKRKE